MWGSEVDQRERTELRTQLSTDTRPPNLATLQPNLVKILPCLMPSTERKREMEERMDKRKGLGKETSKKRERQPVRVFEMGSHESKKREGGRKRDDLGRGGRGIKGTLSSKGLPRAGS